MADPMSTEPETLRAELWAVLDLEPQSDRDLVETVRNLRAFRDERHRIVLRSLDEVRAELARRDTTIAAALGKCDETAALAFQAAHGNQMHTTTMYSVTASIRTSTIRELLSASDETDPRADCGCCDGSWRLCRGLVDKGMARCCADCTHDLSAPVEAGTPAAEPAPGRAGRVSVTWAQLVAGVIVGVGGEHGPFVSQEQAERAADLIMRGAGAPTEPAEPPMPPSRASLDAVRAPFTRDQVAALNDWQERTDVHPFTCANRNDGRHKGEGKLLAYPAGWVCPSCDYTQDWAHAFMASHGHFVVRLAGPADDTTREAPDA